MQPEMLAACQYLSAREDYVIWGGFAAWALLDMKATTDIDLYMLTAEAAGGTARDLAALGWAGPGHKGAADDFILTMAREGVTVDIVFCTGAAILFSGRRRKEVAGVDLYFVSDEGLFLTKLGHLLSPTRDPRKKERDLIILDALRTRIDAAEVKRLLALTTEKFWREGYL